MRNVSTIFKQVSNFEYAQTVETVEVGVGLKNCIGGYSCSWKTFIFYVFFNSNFWFWLDFGVIIDFLGSKWAIFGVRVGCKNCFGVFLTFLGPMSFFWGWASVQKLFWGHLICTNNFCFLSFGGGGGSQWLLCLNPTTVIVVLLLGLWLLLGCDNTSDKPYNIFPLHPKIFLWWEF